MARVKVSSFTSGDILYLEHKQVMGIVATALDKLQGESQAYLGCLLSILSIAMMKLRDLRTRPLSYCRPLVEALLAGTTKRFGPVFEDTDCQLATAFHPKFRLLWLQLHNTSMLTTVRLKMEDAVEDWLRQEAVAVAGSAASSSSDTSIEEGAEDDWFTPLTKLSTSRTTSSSARQNIHKTRAQKLVVNWLEGSPRMI
jgi:hypothetical protein